MKNKTKQYIIGIFTIALMISSVLGVLNSNFNSKTKSAYNGYDFELKENIWELKQDGKTYTFFLHPTSLPYISIDNLSKTVIKQSNQLILAFNPNSSDIETIDSLRFFFTQNMLNMGVQVGGAVTQNSTQYPLPLVNCENPEVTTLVMEESNITEITFEGCIKVKGTGTDFIALTDYLTYLKLGVVE